MPQFSVIVPVYNGATYLEQTLDSLVRQTATDFEVIVVDDGSTDGSAEIALRHELQPMVLRQKNYGVAVARNRGVAAASGEWLAFIDQDDLWHARRLEELSKVVRSTQAGVVVTPDRMFGTVEDRGAVSEIDPEVAGMATVWVERGTEIDRLCGEGSSFDLDRTVEDRWITVAQLLEATVVTTTSFIVRADFMALIGGWSLHGKSLDDWWLMVNAARISPLLMVDEPTHFYRIHSKATSLKPGLFFSLATSVLALRFGGNVMCLQDALADPGDSRVLRHLFLRVLSSPEFAENQRMRRKVALLGELLWGNGWATARVRRRRLRNLLAASRAGSTRRGV